MPRLRPLGEEIQRSASERQRAIANGELMSRQDRAPQNLDGWVRHAVGLETHKSKVHRIRYISTPRPVYLPIQQSWRLLALLFPKRTRLVFGKSRHKALCRA
jgi:hypothetical protein